MGYNSTSMPSIERRFFVPWMATTSDTLSDIMQLTCSRPTVGGPFYWHGLTLIPAWKTNDMYFKMWDEITYPEVSEWISNFVPHFTGHVITYSCWE